MFAISNSSYQCAFHIVCIWVLRNSASSAKRASGALLLDGVIHPPPAVLVIPCEQYDPHPWSRLSTSRHVSLALDGPVASRHPAPENGPDVSPRMTGLTV